MFSDNKLCRIFLLSILLAIALPLLNIFMIYPKFNAVLVSNMEDIAVRLATHIQGHLGDGWDDLIRGEGQELTAEFPVLIEDFGLLKMKIFSSEGNTAYSTDTGQGSHQGAWLHDAVASGDAWNSQGERHGFAATPYVCNDDECAK